MSATKGKHTMGYSHIAHRALTELAAISGVCRKFQKGLRILMYHAIGGDAYGDSLGNYSLSPECFARHMDVLCEMEGNIVPLSLDVLGALKTNFSVSFDDGYLDNLRFAAPILIERQIPFTVFVSSKFVQNQHPGFLNPNELRELSELPGVTIGAHGMTHVHLGRCNELTLNNELSDSKMYLEDIIGRPVSAMSYPYGGVTKQVRDSAFSLGYKIGACSHVGLNRRGCDPLLLARMPIFRQDSVEFFKRKLEGCWDWYGVFQRDLSEI